jgi:hypothetical protein
MSLRIPQKIKIINKTWRVKRNDNSKDWDKYWGLCDLHNRCIFINPELHDGDKNTDITFIHELLHAIWPRKICSMKLEEKLILKLSEKLYHVIKSNTDILRYYNNKPGKARRKIDSINKKGNARSNRVRKHK